MSQVMNAIIGGLALGGTYTLMALGLVVAFRATGTFNIAHGGLVVIAAFVTASLQAEQGLSFGISALVAVGLVATIGAVFYKLVLERTVGMSHFVGLVSAIGLAAILEGSVSIFYGAREFSLTIPIMPTGVVEILGVRIKSASVVMTLITIGLGIVVALVFRYTHLGTKARAAGQDPVLASQGGINVRSIYMGSWALAGVLGGLAGIAYGSTHIVNPALAELALLAFPAVILGGMDSIEGAIVGGLLVGVVQGFVSTFWEASTCRSSPTPCSC